MPNVLLPVALVLAGTVSVSEWVVHARRHLREPELPRVYSGRTVTRFTLVPPFPAWRVLSITISQSGDGGLASSSSVSNWDEATPRLVQHPGQRLSRLQWSRLLERLDNGLWNYAPEPVPRPGIQDGRFWVVEALGPAGYKQVIQHEPENGPFVELCKAILLYSGVELTYMEPEPY